MSVRVQHTYLLDFNTYVSTIAARNRPDVSYTSAFRKENFLAFHCKLSKFRVQMYGIAFERKYSRDVMGEQFNDQYEFDFVPSVASACITGNM